MYDSQGYPVDVITPGGLLWRRLRRGSWVMQSLTGIVTGVITGRVITGGVTVTTAGMGVFGPRPREPWAGTLAWPRARPPLLLRRHDFRVPVSRLGR